MTTNLLMLAFVAGTATADANNQPFDHKTLTTLGKHVASQHAPKRISEGDSDIVAP